MTLMNSSWNRNNYSSSSSRPLSVGVDYGYYASLKKVPLPRWQRQLWLMSPMQEWQSLPHWLDEWQVVMSGSLFIGCGQIFSSLDLNCLRTTLRHLLQSSAAYSQLSICDDFQGIHVALADIFEAQLGVANNSLARGKFATEDVLGYTAILHPAHVANHHSLHCLSSLNMVERLAHSRIWALGTLSLHWMLRMWQRQCMWKLFILRSWLEYVVHLLLP